jgi:hypothetical protein
LDNGDAYEFQVIATNIVGDSEPQDPPVTATPFQSPGMIDSVEARNIGADVYLDWSDPPPGDGATIVDHRVQYKLASDDDQSWSTYGDTGSTNSSVTISRSSANLVVGQTYVFRVAYLLNVSGQDDLLLGTYTQSNSLTVGPVAPAPQDFDVWKEANGDVRLMWDPITIPGGVTFHYFKSQYRLVFPNEGDTTAEDQDDTFAWNDLPNSDHYQLMIPKNGFVRGSTYKFRVAAVTNTGRGGWGVSQNFTY